MKNFKEFGKLYEFEENSKLPVAEQAFFMDNLYKRVKEEIRKANQPKDPFPDDTVKLTKEEEDNLPN